jgi:glycosyltransferase involved in cell wall biosynthesis
MDIEKIKSLPVLSIAIPTKDRYDTLTNVLETLLGWTETEFEIIVHDNSTSNQEILDFLNLHQNDKRLKYFHVQEKLSVNENCDLSIVHATGDYVCLIGDDDGLIEDTIRVCKWMKLHNIDSANCNIAIYDWPSLKSKYYGDYFTGELRINSFSSTYQYIDPQKDLIKTLKNGAQFIVKGPRLYQGIVSKKCLDQLYQHTGTYFPGPVPDMSSAVGIVPYLSSHVYFDYPLIIAGSSAKSTAGQGALKKHHGEIEDIPFLPKDTAANWSKELPRYWSAQTIWAEGALKALSATNNGSLIKYYNFNRLYAACLMYVPDYRDRTMRHINEMAKAGVCSKIGIIYHFILICKNRFITLINSVLKLAKLNFSSTKSIKLETVGLAIKYLQSITDGNRMKLQ